MATSNDPKAAKRLSRLYQLNAIETKDEFEEKWELSFSNLQNKLKDLSEKESHDAVVALANQNYEDLTCGFLYGILIDPQQASRVTPFIIYHNKPKYYRDLTLVTRDGMLIFVTKLNYILVERYPKLLEIPRQQIIWIVREAIKNNMQYMDNVCLNLLRDIVGGDISPKNVWLADNFLSIFLDYRQWLEKYPLLMGNVVYCYLRLIADHTSPGLENLRAKEIRFCISLLREKMIEILNIGGREISRALLAVSRIPEFEKLWYDIMNNPSTISPQFTGVWQLVSARCQKRVTLCRLTVEMERKIYFLLSQVRSSSQAKYFEWLQRQFLSTPESISLRSDIIRYVCCMVHPSNEILASDIVPRWQFVLWLLSTCTSAAETQLCRMALFYDYMFFEPEKESIMNIEPAVLLLFNTLKTQPSLFLSLMDFISRITITFCPTIADQIKACFITSFKVLVEKKVVPTLSPLFDSPKIDADLKCIIREVFDEFCNPKDKEEEIPAPAPSTSPKLDLDDVPLLIDDNGSEDIIDESRVQNSVVEDNEDSLVIDNGNDDEIDVPKKKERRTSQLAMWESEGSLINPLDDPAPADISQSLDQLDSSLRLLVEDMQKLSEDDYIRGDRLYKVVMQIFNLQDEFDEEQATILAECLCGLFRPFFARKVYPDKIEDSESDLEESLRAPIFVIFRQLTLTPDDDSDSQRPLLLLTSEMYLKQQRIGYLLLYFLKANGGCKWSVYNDICKLLDEDIDVMVLKDMKLCQEDDYKLFLYLVPELYREKLFSTFAYQSAELMHLIVSAVDAVQLQELICEIIQGNLIFFKKDTNFVNLLNASLKWETIEQFFLWELVNAHEIPFDWFIPIIQKLTFPVHAEAMASILLILRRMDKEPTMPLVRQILNREVVHQKTDLFAVSALKILIDDYEDRMADLITALLTKSSVSSESTSGGHSKGKKPPVKALTLDPILGHLDMFRRHNKQLHNFFSKEIVQQAMQEVKKSASESLKTKYSELFAMMEILDSIRDGRNLRRGRKVAPASTGLRQSTTGDSSDDDHLTKSPVKQQVKKKRKIVESESD